MEEAFDFSLFGNESLPLVVSPKKHTTREQFLELLAGHGDALKKQLLEHGGVLFRGFPLEGAADFQAAIEALKTGSSVDYIGGDSPRTKVTGAVYTSTEAPAAVKIPLHNELSFVSHYPKHIYFYCDVAPSEKGETILGDARKIYRALEPSVRDRFMQRGLKYVSCYYGDSWVMDLVNSLQPSHKSWRQVFETDSTDEVERLCREHEFDFAWHGGSSWIRISQTRPAAMAHPETKEWVWFSQAHLYDFNPRLLGAWRWVAAKAFYARKHTRLHEVFHSDGRTVARRDLYHIMDTLDRSTVAFPWKRGDMLMLDNVLAMHGRATFAGKRRILAAMTS
ncbi:MAG TPA: TauD/TfdA family dioxygenase [Polyangiaceae bacterium]|jgi:alpha-ketoglutarate-dependent taurine dioxygenase|nr:TauD/TfdA family dioxygenase [Polyangiaceae bacterium]